MPSARFQISGRVQGVFFRASTRERALALGIEGWARNLADGRVEVLAQADDDDAMDRLEAWLHEGPPQSRVASVTRERIPAQTLQGFTIE